MKSPTIIKEKVDVNLAEEVMQFGLKAGAVVAGLIGIWALSCLTAALLQVGPLEMMKGYITAITGV